MGYDITEARGSLLSLGTLFPILSIGYVLGILTDRIADWTFDKIWGEGHWRGAYPEGDLEAAKQLFFRDRRTLVVDGEALWTFIEYGRSRLRICRGWAVNLFLIAIAFDVYWFFGGHENISVDGIRVVYLNIFLILWGLLCGIAWAQLNRKEYTKIRRQAAWVREHREASAIQDVRLTGTLGLGTGSVLELRGNE
ncbi:MAG: hypothetical protein AAGM22_17905 [Acidobacteriota bacterium]